MSHSTLFISYKRLLLRFEGDGLGWRASPFPSLPVLSGFLWPLELCSPTNPVWLDKTKLSWPTVDRRSFACALVYTCSLDYGNWSWTWYCWSPHCPTALSTEWPPVQPPYRNIKNITVSLFCNDLENQNLATFSNGKNVYSMWLEWIEKFNEVLDTHAPLRSPQGSNRKVQRRTRCDCPWMTPELRLLIRQKLKAHRQLTKDPSKFFIVLRRNATKLSRALKNRHFMDMCNEHSKSPRKLWSLLNSLTGRVKSHPPPQATLNSQSETLDAIVSDPSRPVHLVQTAETVRLRPVAPVNPHRSDVDWASFLQMVQNLLQNIDSRKATGADGIPGLLLKKYAPNLAPSLTAIFIASFAAR